MRVLTRSFTEKLAGWQREQLTLPGIRIATYPTFVEEMNHPGVQIFLQ